MKYGRETRSAVAFLLALWMILLCAFPVFGDETLESGVGKGPVLMEHQNDTEENGDGVTVGGITSSPGIVTGGGLCDDETSAGGITTGGVLVTGGGIGTSESGITTENGISGGKIGTSVSGSTDGNSVSGSTDDNPEDYDRDFYFLEVEYGPGGIVSPSGVIGVLAGRDQEIEIIPDSGYYCCTFILDYRYDFSELADGLRFFNFMNANDDRHVYVGFAKREAFPETEGEEDGGNSSAGANSNSSGNGNFYKGSENGSDVSSNRATILLETEGDIGIIFERDGERMWILGNHGGKEDLEDCVLWRLTIFVADCAHIPSLTLPKTAGVTKCSVSTINEFFNSSGFSLLDSLSMSAYLKELLK